LSDESQGRATLVVLATYNERGNIDRLLDPILALPNRCDVLVVDDNSPDGTGAHVRARGEAEPRIKLLARAGRGGVGSAHREAWGWARRAGYARIVTMDADLSHDPLDIPRFLAALDAGADVALGSRFVEGGRLDYAGWRRFLSLKGNALARKALGLPISEYTTSFRAARLERVPAGLIESIPNDGYSFFLTAAVRLVRQRLRVTEIPIHFHERGAGVSKMPRLEILRGMANLIYHIVYRRPFAPSPAADVGAPPAAPDAQRRAPAARRTDAPVA
jgi:dolichol-phosphate mannosyltransferase